jgi:hypothetical protein
MKVAVMARLFAEGYMYVNACHPGYIFEKRWQS